jgi:L-rhamnose mutarotase
VSTELELKTKEDYVQYHRTIWKEVVALAKSIDSRKFPISAYGLKKAAFANLNFSENVASCLCLGCKYVKDHKYTLCQASCAYCLFDLQDISLGCLDGLYNRLNEATKSEFLEIAELILNFAVKDTDTRFIDIDLNQVTKKETEYNEKQ